MNNKLKINKERTWVYSPTPNVVIKTTVNAVIPEEKLQVAINKAVEVNEILRCSVVFDSNQETYYQVQPDTIYPINEYCDEWEKVALGQAKEPFRPDRGNLIRFFYSYKEGNTELLLIAHHLMGDGTSYAYLIQDIMRILNGKILKNKPIQLFQMEDLPKKSKLTLPMRIMMNGLNKNSIRQEERLPQKSIIIWRNNIIMIPI
ncbi:condensation domain-containing protein [Anaerosporobacter sp.]